MQFNYSINPIQNGLGFSFTFAQGLAIAWPSFTQAIFFYFLFFVCLLFNFYLFLFIIIIIFIVVDFVIH